MRESTSVSEPPIEGQALIASLLMRHRTELFAYLIAAVRNPHDAEDLLQDVSLAASTSWAQYRPGTPFLAWAREIQSDEKSRALGDVAARLGVKLENAHRASDDAEAALRVMYLLASDTRIPREYGHFIQEQRRLALLQADERRRWKF